MTRVKWRKNHLEDEEVDDDLDQFTCLMLGEYRKRKQEQRKSCGGSVLGHEVVDRSMEEYDMKLYGITFLITQHMDPSFFGNNLG